MRRVALDLGSLCGYAWTDSDAVVGEQSGTWDCRPRSRQRKGHRYLMFRAHLWSILHGHSSDAVIYYETVRRHMSTRSAHVFGAFEGEMQAICAAHEIECVEIGVTQIKKRATGNGRADKVQMIAAAQLKFGVRCDDDNQADALHILDAGLAGLSDK